VTRHLSDQELGDFSNGALAPAELLRADDHLSACDGCRRRGAALRAARDAVEDFERALRLPETHVSDEEMQRHVQRRLPADDEFAVAQHLRACAVCAAHADDLRAWAAGRPRRRLGPVWLAVAAAVLVSVLVPVAVWEMRLARGSQSASLPGLEDLAPAEQGRVREALRARVASLPPFATDLEGTREVLLGPTGRTDAFDVLSPQATATPDDRPAFEWQPLAGADGYAVEVFDATGAVVLLGPPVTATRWAPDAPLARGASYVWQVTARRGGNRVIAPAAPAPPARFRVLDAASAATLRRMEARHADSHLLLGILNTQAGVVAAAVSHFERVAPDDPHADVARRSLERLRRSEATSR
jgi:hypothetical protein